MSSALIHGPFFRGLLVVGGVDVSDDVLSFSIVEEANRLTLSGTLYSIVSGQDPFTMANLLGLLTKVEAATDLTRTKEWTFTGKVDEYERVPGTHDDALMMNFTVLSAGIGWVDLMDVLRRVAA